MMLLPLLGNLAKERPGINAYLGPFFLLSWVAEPRKSLWYPGRVTKDPVEELLVEEDSEIPGNNLTHLSL